MWWFVEPLVARIRTMTDSPSALLESQAKGKPSPHCIVLHPITARHTTEHIRWNWLTAHRPALRGSRRSKTNVSFRSAARNPTVTMKTVASRFGIMARRYSAMAVADIAVVSFVRGDAGRVQPGSRASQAPFARVQAIARDLSHGGGA